MGDGPVVDLSQVVFIDKFSESLAVVVPNLLGERAASGYQFGEVREEIVAATLLKFHGKVGSPVGPIGFEGVGEDGVRWGVTEGFDERFTDSLQVGGYGLMTERIEDPAFSRDGGAFYDLSGVAGDEEQSDAGFVRGDDEAAGDR